MIGSCIVLCPSFIDATGSGSVGSHNIDRVENIENEVQFILDKMMCHFMEMDNKNYVRKK